MKTWLAAVAGVAFCSAALHADVTITQTMTVSGGVVSMSGGDVQSKVVMRIKGLKVRSDIDTSGTSMSSLANLSTKEVYLLRPDQKTATLMTRTAASAVSGSSTDVSFKPTGQSRIIQAVACEEYAIAMALNLADMIGPRMPPDAAAVLQGVRLSLTGTMWIARSGPGADDFITYQKAAAASGIASILGGSLGQGGASMSKIAAALAEAPGIPYLSELSMSVVGDAQASEMMKQMGVTKITTAVTAVSTDPIADDVFAVPADYKVIKQP